VSADGYDFLTNLAQLDGIRIAPLFRVFWHRKGWAVQATDIQGDPVGKPHQVHKSMRRAFNQAGKLNAENGCGPAITLTAKRAA
jgi:hypothetical protein